MFGLRKKTFAFASPRYQRMKTPVSASALRRLSQAGLLIEALDLTQKLFRCLFATVRGPHFGLAQVGHVAFRVSNFFTPAPHTKAQLFSQKSIGQLYALRGRKPLRRFQDLFVGSHEQKSSAM